MIPLLDPISEMNPEPVDPAGRAEALAQAEHPRGGAFNRKTAKDPGAGGVGARLHTEAVDPYESESKEPVGPQPQLPPSAS